MIEGLVTIGASIIIFAVGYGHLRQSVLSNSRLSDERHKLLSNEIENLKREQAKDSEAFTSIKVDLGSIKSDVKNLNDNFTEWKRRIL